MRYFLDTNIFLRFLVIEDKRAHGACKELLRRIRSKKIKAITSSLVLAEIVWVLQSFYKFPKERVIEALRVFYGIGLVLNDRVNIGAALDLYESKNVKFVDALIASHPLLQKKGISIISYDTDFDSLGVTRVTPEAVIKK